MSADVENIKSIDNKRAERLYYALTADVGMVRRYLCQYDVYSSDLVSEDFTILCCEFEKSVFNLLKFIKTNFVNKDCK